MFADRWTHDNKRVAVLFCALLMAATYLAFSIRSVLLASGSSDWISAKRLITTAVGAGMFLLVARFCDRSLFPRLSMRFFAIGAMTLAAMAMVFFARMAFDLVFGVAAEEVVLSNARWVITWLGYFAAALIGYYLSTQVRHLRQSRCVAPMTREAAVAAVARQVSTWSEADRLALVELLAPSARYEEADPLAQASNHG